MSKKRLFSAFLLACGLVAAPAAAQTRPGAAPLTDFCGDGQARLVVNVGSRHLTREFEPAGGYNESNTGIGIDFISDKKPGWFDSHFRSSCGVSTYRNSFHRDSVEAHIGGELSWPLARVPDMAVTAGVQGGLVTGYRDGDTPIPYAALTAGVEYRERFFVRTLWVPKVDLGEAGRQDAVVGLQAGINFRF